jgi:hypothetical protein
MSTKTRLFWILWVPGMLGVLSFLLVDLHQLIATLPQPEGEPFEMPRPALLKLASVAQPAILMTLAVAIGVWLADKIGLHSPAAEAAAAREPIMPKLAPQIVPGVLAGIATGAAIITTWVVAKPFLTEQFIKKAEEFNNLLPFAVRILYGGIVEELLLRWGFMTFVVWLTGRIVQRADGPPKSIYFILAIVFSALMFGAGHLPIASLLSGELTLPLVMYVLTANSIFGLVAGFLYWKRGLESAIIAHMFAHVVLIIAISFSL